MLSTRYNIYSKGNATWNQAYELGQARYYIKGFKLPDNASKYAYDNFWTKLPKPYTMHRSVGNFLTDYIEDAAIRHPLIYKSPDELFIKSWTIMFMPIAFTARYAVWIPCALSDS